MQNKRFTKIDENFTCIHCGYEVKPLGYTCRNHCPKCLWSVHLDENPGDRQSDCGGELEPIAAETDTRHGYNIVHRCVKCGAVKKNKTAHEAAVQPDDIKKIIALTVNRDARF